MDKSDAAAATVYKPPARMSEIHDSLIVVLQISLRTCLRNSSERCKFVEHSRGSYVNKSGVATAIVYRTTARMSEIPDTHSCSADKFTEQPRESRDFQID